MKQEKQKIRIIQIIDSLESGGAERMAVNYTNALVHRIEFSGLVVTRREGILKNQLDVKANYLFLNKKSSVDLKSIFRLRSFVKAQKIDIIHAHGTSFFTSVLLKLIYPKVKIIWQEHYGARADQSRLENLILFFSSFLFSGVLVVNHQLENWVKKKLLIKKVFYIPNFVTFENDFEKATFLEGDKDKRIVCLANLKKPKNHIAILSAFKELKLKDLGWTLHLVGKDYEDSYSILLKDFIRVHNLEDFIFIYGSKYDVQNILSQATIGILASTSEGFPLTLLEYGLAKLPVMSTNVGYCPLIIKDNLNGLLFEPLSNRHIQEQLQKMISEKGLRDSFALHLYESILDKYSRDGVITVLLLKYNSILKAKQ
ncbi:glycosyltransferase [Flavobacterium sp. LB2P44]|uniref:glycosyltransferase n=1 Tax=Flavobacterium sp. LB2P44 TaxID=3401713 RepID=UPI003AAF7682